MNCKVFVILLLVNVTFKVATANTIEDDTSLFENLHYRYQNGTLICGYVPCHANRCIIRQYSDELNKRVVHQKFTCLGGGITAAMGNEINLINPKLVDNSLEVITSESTAAVIANLKHQYVKGKLFCGGIQCPAEAIGCVIHQRSYETFQNRLSNSNYCVGEDMQIIQNLAYLTEISPPREVNNILEIFISIKNL